MNLGERCAIDVRETVARLLELYRESIAGRDLTLSFEVAEGLAARVEPQLLDRALAGVLAYSVEAATRDLKVAGRFALEGHCVELTVSYDGDGFEPGSAEFSFDQEGLRRDLAVALDGGLAGRLPLIRCAVELAGGRLTHDSRGPGQGARFVVLLPLAERAT